MIATLEKINKGQDAIDISGIFNSILGSAGTGKTYWLKQQMDADPYFALVASSTGVSALNVDGFTIHSVLGYYDTTSLYRKYQNGELQERLAKIAKKYRYLCIDEISMLPGEQITLICYALVQSNKNFNQNLKLIVLGDAAQLPTINSNAFFFQTKPWQLFTKNSLTEVKRQNDRDFIAFLHSLRTGEVKNKIDWFAEHIGFSEKIENDFLGTTILSTNKRVDTFNHKALAKIDKLDVEYPKIITGKPKSEWKLVPEKVILKPNCKVIITVNNHREGYCNGDLATVTRCFKDGVEVELERNKTRHLIGYLERKNVPSLGKVSVGCLQFLPLRLAYALTIHRTQGLTLDKLQCRLGDSFLNNLSGGLYVIFSRIRDYKNLKIVGNKTQLISGNYVNPEIKEFLLSYEK